VNLFSVFSLLQTFSHSLPAAGFAGHNSARNRIILDVVTSMEISNLRLLAW